MATRTRKRRLGGTLGPATATAARRATPGAIAPPDDLARITRDVIACDRCPRLRRWCQEIAANRRRAFRDQEYWGRPVPGFGDPGARIWIVGLAPGAHGSNRTGRMFTGDASGDWLYRALHAAGLARLPTAVARDDGQALHDVYISAAARCAPPDNKPRPVELHRCAPYLARELAALERVRVVVALGQIAFDAALRLLAGAGWALPRPRPRFAHLGCTVLRPAAAPSHGATVARAPITLLASYHPSRQNTQTGKLSRAMLDAVFHAARQHVTDKPNGVRP
jgi:uracil-DNA glycosylase family 4